ncbi:MAG TPA: GAF domain-containing protein [Jatrophihabitantaceae bacterium]|nr:GAF domain-containing protein [Jatrophihabitantaceae bacterium]
MARDMSEALAQVDALRRLIDEHHDVVALLDSAAVLREAAHRIRDRAGMDIGYAAQIESNDLLVIRGWSGACSSALRNLEVRRGLGLGGKSYALARPVWVHDYCTSRQITHDFDEVVRAEGIGAMVAVPLVHDGRLLGVVYGARRESVQLGDTALHGVEDIAEPAGTALHLAQRAEGQTEAALFAERQRIAIALHDSVGAMLFSIGAEVRDLQSTACAHPELLAKLRGVEARVADTAAAFRESLAVLDMVTPNQALTATLRGDCEEFGRRTGVTARCVALTDVPVLDDAHCAAVVAVVREALVNVEKHAEATSVVVSVAATDGGVAVAIADDGLGWTAAGERATGPVNHSTGIGLQASYNRLARLGGALSVVGNEDGGLTVRTWVPAA